MTCQDSRMRSRRSRQAVTRNQRWSSSAAPGAWMSEGALPEGAAAAAAALASPAGEIVSVWRVRALYGDGVIAFREGARGRALARNEEALSLARETNDIRGECEALTGLARVALRDSEYRRVVELASEGRRIARGAGDREAEAAPLHLQAEPWD